MQQLPTYKKGCEDKDDIQIMQFVYPVNASSIYIPKDIDGQIQKVVFELAHRCPEKKIFWHLDDEFLGETVEIHQMQFFADEGEHIITAVDEDGNSIRRKVLFLSSY